MLNIKIQQNFFQKINYQIFFHKTEVLSVCDDDLYVHKYSG
jgi:hypothetical protein